MSLAVYLRRVRETYYRCRKTVHILIRRLKRRADNANVETRPVIPRPRRWTRSYMQNKLKHAAEGVSGFVRRSRWRLVSGNTPARRDQRVAPQYAIHVSHSIHRQTTSSIDVPTVNHTSRASTISTHSILSNPHDVNPSTVTPPRNSTEGTIQLTARALNSPSIARSGSSTLSELSPMNRMTVTDLPPSSPDSGACVQSSIPSRTTVQSFDGPNYSSYGGRMHIFPIDKAHDLYYKLPFPYCISFSAEANNDVAEISVTTTLTQSPPCLPDAIISQILKHVIASHPLVPIAELRQEICNISPKWWSLAEDHVDSLVLFPLQNQDSEHRDITWLERIASHDSFDTVAYFSQVPDKDQDWMFTNALYKCRRVVIVKPAPLQGLFGGHCPTMDFGSPAPWSHLAELHLECLIAKADAYCLLAQGRITLQTVTMTIDSEEDLALSVLEPLEHLLTFENPTLSNTERERPLDPIILEHLHSLTIFTHTNLNDIFSALTLPSLVNFNLDAYAATLPGNNFPWYNLKCLSLRGHLNEQFALDAILVRSLQLTSFAWNGTRASYSLSATSIQIPNGLENVVIDSDTLGCNNLAKFLRDNAPAVKSMTISSVSSDCVPSTLTALTVLDEVSFANLNDILRTLNRLEHGQFVLDTGAGRFTALSACPKLKMISFKSHDSLQSLRETLREAKWVETINVVSGGSDARYHFTNSHTQSPI